MTPSKAVLLLTMAGAVLLPGVAGAQTTTVPSRTCPPPWIMSSWTDYDDVYQVTLANRRSPLGIDCQYTTVGVVARAVPEQTVLYSTAAPLALIGPGGVPAGPPAQVAVTLPALGCGSHNVQIDVVADAVSFGRKLERVDNAPCPPVTTAAPLPPTTTVPVATSSPPVAQPVAAGPTEIVRQPRVEPNSTNLMSPTSTPPVTEAASVTTTSQATRVLGISAAAPAATPIATVDGSGNVPPPGVNHAGLFAGLSAIVAGAIAVLIGWRRRAGRGWL